MERLIATLSFLLLASCAGSPARMMIQTPEQIYTDLSLSKLTVAELCQWLERVEEKAELFLDKEYVDTASNAAGIAMLEKGRDARYCSDPELYQYLFENEEPEEYFIDLLKITVEQRKTDICTSGGIYKVSLDGTIGPDSSFAMGRLLGSSPHCKDSSDRIIVATTISLSSGGGLLEDGYALGRILRKEGATVIAEQGNVCASSCAVAFLGGERRAVEDGAAIMFHAPYYTGANSLGQQTTNCDVGEVNLEKLNAYYSEMVGKDAGDRLFERTMSYCTADDGWVVSGSNAAELYDIATDRF